MCESTSSSMLRALWAMFDVDVSKLHMFVLSCLMPGVHTFCSGCVPKLGLRGGVDSQKNWPMTKPARHARATAP